MHITVKLFALGRDLVGKNELPLPLPDGATVQTALDYLNREYPKFRQLTTYMVAVNMEYADRSQQLRDGDEIAIIPPVSGG